MSSPSKESPTPRSPGNWAFTAELSSAGKPTTKNIRQALTRARNQRQTLVTDRFQGILGKAADVLLEFLKDPDPNNRYRAAQTLLQMANAFKPPPNQTPDADHDL